MAPGHSGSYAVNGSKFLLQPSTAGWNDRDNLGFDGGGHIIYPPLRSFSVQWGLAHPNDVAQLIDVYNSIGNTGTVVFDLPKWKSTSEHYSESYSGCTMSEPKMGNYFNGYIEDVSFQIFKIVT